MPSADIVADTKAIVASAKEYGMCAPLTIHVPPNHPFAKMTDDEVLYEFGAGIKVSITKMLPA